MSRPIRKVLGVIAPILFATACGDGSTGPQGSQPTKIGLTPPAAALTWVGDSRQLTAQVIDQRGVVLPDETVSWSSGDASVATVSSSGLVVASGPGQTVITASSGAASHTASVIVNQAPETLIKVLGDAQEGSAGSLLPDDLVVELQDQGGVPISGAQIVWTVTSGGGVIVAVQNPTDETGRASAGWVLGGVVGTQSVTARSGVAETQFSAEAIFAEEGEFSVSSVAPFPIQEGQPAFVTGTGLAGSTVAVGGIPAEVTEFTDTQLTFTVPIGSCQPTRSTSVRVDRGESSATLGTTVVPQILLDPLPIGGGWIDQGADEEGHCLHFSQVSENVSYLVGVQSLAESASILTPTEFTMGTGITATMPPPRLTARYEAQSDASYRSLDGSVANVPVSGSRAPIQGVSAPRTPDLTRLRHAIGHLDQRAADAEEIRRLRSIPGSRVLASAAPLRQAPPTVGEEIMVRVPDGCTEFTTITATVREVGERSIWLEDQNNPTGGFSDTDYEELSMAYDAVIGERLDQFAGPPTDLDTNGRIVVVVTREVNDRDEGGILGFVTGADLFSTASCPSSNEGEYFYGVAPDPGGATQNTLTLEDTRDLYPSLVAHEVTHIIHLSRQIYFVETTESPEVWELEGFATFMEELVGHAFTGLGSGLNIPFAPLFANLDWYGNLLSDLVAYFGFDPVGTKVPGAPHECSWLGRPPNGPCVNDARMPYGVPASLMRWIADQFYTPSTESQMTRAIVDSPVHGFDLLGALSGGAPLDQLMASWAGALVADDIYFSSGLLTFSSWNFGDIYGGLVPSARPQPGARGHEFEEALGVRAGSTAYFIVSGSHGQISFGAPGLPPHMRLWAIRVE